MQTNHWVDKHEFNFCQTLFRSSALFTAGHAVMFPVRTSEGLRGKKTQCKSTMITYLASKLAQTIIKVHLKLLKFLYRVSSSPIVARSFLIVELPEKRTRIAWKRGLKIMQLHVIPIPFRIRNNPLKIRMRWKELTSSRCYVTQTLQAHAKIRQFPTSSPHSYMTRTLQAAERIPTNHSLGE